jgi:hypothetical protein
MNHLLQIRLVHGCFVSGNGHGESPSAIQANKITENPTVVLSILCDSQYICVLAAHVYGD